MADAERMICGSNALAERGKGVRFTLEHQGATRPAFAIRYEGRVYAYLNSCAHVSVELDWLGPVNHYRVRCVAAKIVDGKALGAAHIANMGKTSNDASGDFGHNPKGRDDLGSWRCRTFAYLPRGKPRSALLALSPNRLRRTHAVMVNRS